MWWRLVTNLFSTVASNDLEALKQLSGRSDDSGIEAVYYMRWSILMTSRPQIFQENEDGDTVRQVNPDKSFDAVGLAIFIWFQRS